MLSSHPVSLLRLFALFTLLALSWTRLSGGEERALLVPVEVGIHRIQVEIRDAETGAWSIYSIAHLDGQAGTVKLRIPAGLPRDQIRVRATAQALVPSEWIDDDSTVRSAVTIETEDYAMRATPDLGIFSIADDELEVVSDDEVVESDIWKLDETTLYFFNQLRGLQVFDLENASTPKLTGSLRYPARGEQMYQLDADHLLLLARSQSDTQVELVRLNDGAPYIAETLTGMPGYYVESRLVGNRLYVVTQSGHYEEAGGIQDWIRTLHVNGFDFSDPSNPKGLGELVIPLDQGWGNAVTATHDTLIVAVNQHVYDETESDWWNRGWHYRSEVYLIDLKSADGVPRIKASAPLAGRVLDKFKLRLQDNVLTAITQAQGYNLETYTVEVTRPRTPPSLPPDYIPTLPPIGEDGDPEVIDPPEESDSIPTETVTVTRTRRVWYQNTVLENLVLDGDSLEAVGMVELAEGENLRATRFDQDRAYVVTFQNIDPLFIVDLTDPTDPTILGELEVPGWSSYLQVLANDRLFSIGVESGRVALSLFDVADPAAMSLLARVFLGDEGDYSWSEATYDEKAISLFPEQGLALVPYQSYNYRDGSYRYEKALQVVEITDDELILRGSLTHGDQARRASLLNDEAIVSISNEELLTASIVDLDAPEILANLTIAWDVDNVFVVGDYLLQVDRQNERYYYGASDPNQSMVRISPMGNSDALLTEFSLEPGTIRGLTVRAGKLYALYLDFDRDYSTNTTNISRYRLEVYDVSDPLEAHHQGTALLAFELPDYYWLDSLLQAAWIDANTLVWMPKAQEMNNWWYWDWYYLLDVRYLALDCCWWLPSGLNEAHLLVADVTHASTPRFTDGINLTPDLENGSIAYSEAILTGNRVSLSESYHWWEQIEIPDAKEYPYYRYENHVENHFISIAVNSEGLLSAPFKAEIPGTLTGVTSLEDAALVVFTRERQAANTSDESTNLRQKTVLYAHLFDGAQLLPIDQTALPPDHAYSDSQLDFAFADRVIYRAGHDYAPELDRLSAIDRIQFGDDGHFTTLESLVVPNVSRHDLDVLEGHLLDRNEQSTLLWAIDGTQVDFLDRFDPPTATTWWGWSWNQGGDPAIVAGEGLWIPAGSYGIDAYPLEPSSIEAAAAPLRFDRYSATGWDEIDSAACTESPLEATDTVGPMTELRWRFKAANFATVDPAALDDGDYWYESAWYGWYHQRGNSQWIYHLKHGWLWASGGGERGTWLYDLELGWCWTRDSVYPYLYNATRDSWLYFYEGSEIGTRWFYQFAHATGDPWFSVPQSE